jgi:hypothetical protein
MDYTVYPICISNVNWPIFTEVCRDQLNYNPLRKFDEAGLMIKDPVLFIPASDFTNSAYNILRCKNVSANFKHISMTFMVRIESHLLLEIMQQTELIITFQNIEKSNDCIIIMSGTTVEWIRTILYYCQENTHCSLRKVMSNVYNIIHQTCLKEFFNMYKKSTLLDGTIIFKD